MSTRRHHLQLAGVLALALVIGFASFASVSTSAHAATSSASPAPGVDDDWTRGAHDLLAFVPREVREQCQVRTQDGETGIDQDLLDAELGALACTAADGAIDVRYVQFGSKDEADAYVDQTTNTSRTDDVDQEPGDCPTQFRTVRGDEDVDVGRYLCFLADDATGIPVGTPVITWTYEPHAIVAQASDADLDLARLRKFWADTAGPLAEADRHGIPPLATRVSLRTAGKALLASAPAASRHECNVIDSLTPHALGSTFGWRLWVVADIEECRPGRGSTDTEYMQFATGGVTDAFMGELPQSYLDDERVTVHGTQCGGAGTWRRDGRTAGRYMCWFSNDDTDAEDTEQEFAHFRFSDIEHRLVVTGGAPAAKVKALLAWWNDDARLG